MSVSKIVKNAGDTAVNVASNTGEVAGELAKCAVRSPSFPGAIVCLAIIGFALISFLCIAIK